MTFLELAQRRKSTREYMDKPVEKEKLELILEGGRLAPSAVNCQPWYFIVIRDVEIRNKIAESYNQFNYNNCKNVPVFIVVCGDHKKSWHRKYDGKDYCDVDIALAVDHMALAAADLGLATCWICAFDPVKCSKTLELPEHIDPIAILHVGYPASDLNPNEPKNRKRLDEIAFWDKFTY